MPYDRYAFQEFRQNFISGSVPQEFPHNPTIQDILVFMKEKYHDLLLDVREDPHLRLESSQLRSVVQNAYALANWSLLLAYKYNNRDVPVATNAHPEENPEEPQRRNSFVGEVPTITVSTTNTPYFDFPSEEMNRNALHVDERITSLPVEPASNEALQRGLRYLEGLRNPSQTPRRP